MRVTNQGGSLAGFIIIGVLLTLVLVGGLYGLNRYNAQRAAEEVATSDESATEPAPAKEEAATGGTEPTGRERTDTAGGTDSATPAPAPAQPSAPATKGGAATQANLPQTGPADTLGSFVALGLLAFAGAHYARSRARS